MGESSVTATVRAIDDDMTEGTEKVAVTVRHGGEDIGDAEVRVLDNEGIGVSFGAAAYEVTEGGTVQVQVRLAVAPTEPVVVTLTASAGAGLTAGEYAVPDSVAFPAGMTETTFPVRTTDDGDDEDDELGEVLTIGIDAEALPEGYTVGSPANTLVTLLDDDDPVVSVSFGEAAYEATEGGSVAVTVLLSETPDREVVVPLTVSRGGGLAAGDYEGVPPSVTFGPEETETSFTVAAVDDGAQESEERLTLRFGQRPDRVDTGATASAVVTVLDDDGPPGPPVGLVATLGDRFVRLTWGAPSPAGDSPIDRYEVRRDRGAWRDAGTLTEYTFSNLQNEREYAFEVRARNVNGAGAAAATTGIPTPEISALPQAVRDLRVDTVYSKRAELDCREPLNALSRQPAGTELSGDLAKLQDYQVQVCTGFCGEEENWEDVAASTGTTETRYVDRGEDGTGLTDLRDRRYRVRAINIHGETGPWSNVAALPPTEINSPLTSATDDDKVEVIFDVLHPDGRDLYVLIHRKGEPNTERFTATIPLRHAKRYLYTFSNLTPSTVYRVTLESSATFDSSRPRAFDEPTHGAGVRHYKEDLFGVKAVEVQWVGDAGYEGEAPVSVTMGGTATYRLRLLPCEGRLSMLAVRGRRSVTAVRIDSPAALLGRAPTWVSPRQMVLECAGDEPGPWQTVTVHAAALSDYEPGRWRENAKLLSPFDDLYTHTVWNSSHNMSLISNGSGLVRVTVSTAQELAQPSNVRLDGATMQLRWGAAEGANGYQVEWRPGDQPYGDRARQEQVSDGMSFDLGERTWTAARVRATSATDVSPWVQVVRPAGPGPCRSPTRRRTRATPSRTPICASR